MKREVEIDIGRCLKALVNKFWLIIIAVIFTGLVGMAITLQDDVNVYLATSSVYSAASGSYYDSIQGTYAMQNYNEVARSLKVCNRAAQILDIEDVDGYDIMESTAVVTSEESNIIYIEGYSENPELAIEYSKALANAFVMEMQNITGSDEIQILDEAYTYKIDFDVESHRLKIRLIAILAGVAISSIYIILSEMFRKKVATIQECSVGGELDIIGVIPTLRK